MIEFYNQPTNNDKWIVDLYKEKRGGYFFEAGALDGVGGSCTYTLERNFSWRGILVEPGKPFKRLVKNRPNSLCLNVCISDRNGQVVFVESNVAGYSGIKDRLIFEERKHQERWGKPKDQWRTSGYSEKTIESITLYDLLKWNGAPKVIDYMALDMEGSEYDALKKFPFEEFKILALSIEGDACNGLLRSKGFVEDHNKFNEAAPWEYYFVHKDLSMYI
jgi:FkbM family methyltransferase